MMTSTAELKSRNIAPINLLLSSSLHPLSITLTGTVLWNNPICKHVDTERTIHYSQSAVQSVWTWFFVWLFFKTESKLIDLLFSVADNMPLKKHLFNTHSRTLLFRLWIGGNNLFSILFIIMNHLLYCTRKHDKDGLS